MQLPTKKINRLSEYDYSTPNGYFITICTKNRRNLFWNHVGDTLAAPTVSTVVNQMKEIVSKEIGDSVWQKGFYDHVVRGDADYRKIWTYIEGNPLNRVKDDLYAENTEG